MRISLFVAAVLAAAVAFGRTPAEYRQALPGYAYVFPRDHFSHPEFQTEWWYYTGNLRSVEDGRRFGFELTFFRHATSPAQKSGSVWDTRDVWLAHFVVSDIDGGRFFHTERLNRSGDGLAGASEQRSLVWNGNWSVRWRFEESRVVRQTLAAVAPDFSVDLELRPLKPPVIHGLNGVSQKAGGPGRASHYISYTRLATSGRLRVAGREFTVEGFSWMDHEFFTHQLEQAQSGWDWMSLQLADGSELMLFRLRRKDGAPDPYSAGTLVEASGRTRHLAASEFSMAPGRTWASPATRGRYPVEWALKVPGLRLDLRVTTRLESQEFTGKVRTAPTYWEGAVEVSGTRDGRAISGAGYLEMTGYGGRVNFGN